jgi:ComF family protein
MNLLTKILYQLQGFLFPGECALCNTGLITSAEIYYGLCDSCAKGLTAESPSCCKLCGRPLISENDTCLSCRNAEKHSYDKIWVLFPYTGKYHKLFTAYKFEKNLTLANYFAELVVQSIYKNSELSNIKIVPVPPRPGKKKSMGWDQVDYLVNKIKKAAYGKINVTKCLKRKKSKAQKSLNRNERINNLHGKIFQRAPAPQTALLIDDVVTTGSTLNECSSVLRKAGSEKVFCLCLFYD